MFRIQDQEATRIEPTSFSKLEMNEHDLEELIIHNPHLIADDESMLIVGQQVRNSSNGICDLVGINQNGNIVLIEIKRDRKDIEARKEAFESQAIRYAAGFATVKDMEELISKIYAPFLETDYTVSQKVLTTTEQAHRNIDSFFQNHNIALQNFNQRQQIILVASEFDEQTISAAAWLNRNGVDITCYKLVPYKIKDDVYIQSQRVLPLDEYEDFFVCISGKVSNSKIKRMSKIEHKPFIEGDVSKMKDMETTAVLLCSGSVEVDGEEKSMEQWLEEVTGLSSIDAFAFIVQREKGRSLASIRKVNILTGKVN